jgi:hypothetical protein
MRRVRIVGEVFATNVERERWGGEGQTLGDALAQAVNGVLSVGDPYGRKHTISLEPFAGEDPNHFLTIRFLTLRDRENFDGFDIGNGVVLKDYEVLADSETPEIIRPPIGDGSFLKKYELPPGTAMLS